MSNYRNILTSKTLSTHNNSRLLNHCTPQPRKSASSSQPLDSVAVLAQDRASPTLTRTTTIIMNHCTTIIKKVTVSSCPTNNSLIMSSKGFTPLPPLTITWHRSGVVFCSTYPRSTKCSSNLLASRTALLAALNSTRWPKPTIQFLSSLCCHCRTERTSRGEGSSNWSLSWRTAHRLPCLSGSSRSRQSIIWRRLALHCPAKRKIWKWCRAKRNFSTRSTSSAKAPKLSMAWNRIDSRKRRSANTSNAEEITEGLSRPPVWLQPLSRNWKGCRLWSTTTQTRTSSGRKRVRVRFSRCSSRRRRVKVARTTSSSTRGSRPRKGRPWVCWKMWIISRTRAVASTLTISEAAQIWGRTAAVSSVKWCATETQNRHNRHRHSASATSRSRRPKVAWKVIAIWNSRDKAAVAGSLQAWLGRAAVLRWLLLAITMAIRFMKVLHSRFSTLYGNHRV